MKALPRNRIKQCLVLGHTQKVQQAGSAQQQTFYPDLSTGDLYLVLKDCVNQQGGQFSIGVVNCQVQFAINYHRNFRLRKCMLHFTFYWTFSLTGQGSEDRGLQSSRSFSCFSCRFYCFTFQNGSTITYQTSVCIEL